MTFYEVMIPAPGSRDTQVRLYYNRVSAGKRPLVQHSHPMYEFGFFREGSGVFTLKNREYVIQPGDVFFFRGNEQHYVTEISAPDTIECAGLQFSPDFIWSPTNQIFDVKYLRYFSLDNPHFTNRLERGSETTNRIRELLYSIEDEFAKQSPQYSLMVKVNLIAILVLLFREYTSSNPAMLEEQVSIKPENMVLIENTMHYIDEHIREELDIKSIAAVANMSTSYYSQLFKTLNGFSTWDYVVCKRISLAQELLLSTDLSVLDVALQCGFNNTANFNRAFRKITGCSPSEYRKK